MLLSASHRSAIASLEPCLTTAKSPLPSTSSYSYYGLEILKQAVYMILRTTLFKPSFIETDHTSEFYGIPREMPINSASFLLFALVHAPLEVLDSPL